MYRNTIQELRMGQLSLGLPQIASQFLSTAKVVFKALPYSNRTLFELKVEWTGLSSIVNSQDAFQDLGKKMVYWKKKKYGMQAMPI